MKQNIGKLGEELVSKRLQKQGWHLLYHRWHSRWGEIDLILQQPLLTGQKQESLVFVEVKTRSRGNWDLDGLLAITPQKQQKLWQTAEAFLAKHPELAHCPCRFDLALVKYKKVIDREAQSLGEDLDLGKPFYWQGYEWQFQDYLQGIWMDTEI